MPYASALRVGHIVRYAEPTAEPAVKLAAEVDGVASHVLAPSIGLAAAVDALAELSTRAIQARARILLTGGAGATLGAALLVSRGAAPFDAYLKLRHAWPAADADELRVSAIGEYAAMIDAR